MSTDIPSFMWSTSPRHPLRLFVIALPFAAGIAILLGFSSQGRGGTGSPEEVLRSLHEAYRKSGAKGFLPGLTRDSQKTLTGGMVSNFFAFRAFVLSRKEPNPAAVKLLDEVVKKHGLDEKKVKPYLSMMPRSADEAIANLKALSDMVRDTAAFIDDTVETLNRFDAPFPPLTLCPPGAVLKDLKIRSDTATGNMHYRYLGKDHSEPVHFRREGGGWKIDLIPGIQGSFAEKK